MTDYRALGSIGARIKAARRQRGYRTTQELAEAIPGGHVTSAVLENIESGRKADLAVSQLLNIALALGVPPSMLLSPIGTPDAPLDLPNLSHDFEGMTAAAFDSWLSATPLSFHRAALAAERIDIDTLATLRELGMLQRELDRLRVVLEVQKAFDDADLLGANAEVLGRIERVRGEVERIAGILETAGLAMDRGGNTVRHPGLPI